MGEYIQVDWETQGATQGMATLVGLIRKQGGSIIDAGQGAELPLPNGELNDILTTGTKVKFDGLYNTTAGGGDYVQEAAARLVSGPYRVPVATKDNTFVMQTLGRNLFGTSLTTAMIPHLKKSREQGYNPAHIIAKDCWGNLPAMAESAPLGMDTLHFDHTHLDLANAVGEVIEQHGPEKIANVTIVTPNNPDSITLKREQTLEFMHRMDKFNTDPNVNIHVTFDLPYAFGAATAQDDKGRFIEYGVENVLTDDWNTTWTMALSCSKFLAAADDGLSIMVTSPNQPKSQVAKALSLWGTGLARNNELLKNFARVVGGGHDDLLWGRIDNVREKYTRNRQVLEGAFPEWIVPGTPNMLSLLKVPADRLIGHEVICCDGQSRVMENGYDVVEYLANDYGIGLVFMGMDENGDVMLRLAQREEPEVFAQGVQLLKDGLDDIANGPVPTVMFQQGGDLIISPPAGPQPPA